MNLNPIPPKYYFIQHFIKFFCFSIFFIPFPVFGISVLFELFEHILTTKYEAFWLAFFTFLLFDILIVCLASFITKALYDRAHFKILDNRVEYYRDFFVLQIKDLKYKNVKEITLTQGPLQKLFGVGTILLQSHASPQTSRAGSSGLKIYNVENPQKIFSLLKTESDKAES